MRASSRGEIAIASGELGVGISAIVTRATRSTTAILPFLPPAVT